MTSQFYETLENITAGTTLKDPNQALNGNLALHTGENPTQVVANRQTLADALQVDADQFVFANQTHSKKAYQVKADDRGRGSQTTEDAEKADEAFTILMGDQVEPRRRFIENNAQYAKLDV